MSRGAKIAWIVLAVIVVAFGAQRLISPGDEADDGEIPYSELLDRIQRPGEIESVTIDESSGEVEVSPGPSAAESETYEVAYLEDDSERLLLALDESKIPYEVDSNQGGSLVSWLFYLLPFGLFIAFWVWLARRLDRR